jgi:hypothetical protein
MARILRALLVALVVTAAGLVVAPSPAAAACNFTIHPYHHPTNRSNTVNRGGCSRVGAFHRWVQPCNGCVGVTNIVWNSTNAWSPYAAYLTNGYGAGET